MSRGPVHEAVYLQDASNAHLTQSAQGRRQEYEIAVVGCRVTEIGRPKMSDYTLIMEQSREGRA